jgi:hypothetical protein
VQKVESKQTPREPKNRPSVLAIKKLNKGIIIIERYIKNNFDAQKIFFGRQMNKKELPPI